MKVVLATNVIVSGLNFPGNERSVLELALRGRFEFYLSRFILGEAAGVLVRKFGWDEGRMAQAIGVLESAATVIESPRLPEVIGGRARRQPGAGVRGGGCRRLPGDRRPQTPVAHRGTPGHDNRQRPSFPVGADPGRVIGRKGTPNAVLTRSSFPGDQYQALLPRPCAMFGNRLHRGLFTCQPAGWFPRRLTGHRFEAP